MQLGLAPFYYLCGPLKVYTCFQDVKEGIWQPNMV